MGFCPNMSVNECKFRLYRKVSALKLSNRARNHFAVFFDMSSAYDLVDRRILYKLIRDKKILS